MYERKLRTSESFLTFFHLRYTAKLKHFLSSKDLKIVIRDLITSGLDYCSSLYVRLSQSALSRLQIVQNAAPLHWLPVHFRVYYEILLFVYGPLFGLAPKYIFQSRTFVCPQLSM